MYTEGQVSYSNIEYSLVVEPPKMAELGKNYNVIVFYVTANIDMFRITYKKSREIPFGENVLKAFEIEDYLYVLSHFGTDNMEGRMIRPTYLTLPGNF